MRMDSACVDSISSPLTESVVIGLHSPSLLTAMASERPVGGTEMPPSTLPGDAPEYSMAVALVRGSLPSVV